ncbi:MAG: hypothetical protein M5R40_29310 [Anaerolineae bacterium]|nr:hypothetical protein [Anaerolineae bacterium]
MAITRIPSPLADPRHVPPDGAVAQDEGRLAVEQDPLPAVVRHGPVAPAQAAVGGHDKPGRRQEQRGGGLSDRYRGEVQVVYCQMGVFEQQCARLRGDARPGHDKGVQVCAGGQVDVFGPPADEHVIIGVVGDLPPEREADIGLERTTQRRERVLVGLVEHVDSQGHSLSPLVCP